MHKDRKDADNGLYYPDGSYASRNDLVTRQLRNGERVIYHTPVNQQGTDKDFGYWSDIFQERQKQRTEYAGMPEHVFIEIDTQAPICLAFFGDIHAGGQYVDYDRFADEMNACTVASGVYVMTMGDLTDSYFFFPAASESLGSFDEQNLYMKSALLQLGREGKLLAGWGGDHDNWPRRMGSSAYATFSRDTGGHYLEGVSFITLKVGQVEYPIAGAHRHPGFSIYNEAHASQRLYRDSAEGSALVVTAHSHKKAYHQQTAKGFGGKHRRVHFLTLGSFKETDAYSRKHGWGRASQENMGGTAVILDNEKDKIEVAWTITEGIEKLNQARGLTKRRLW